MILFLLFSIFFPQKEKIILLFDYSGTERELVLMLRGSFFNYPPEYFSLKDFFEFDILKNNYDILYLNKNEIKKSISLRNFEDRMNFFRSKKADYVIVLLINEMGIQDFILYGNSFFSFNVQYEIIDIKKEKVVGRGYYKDEYEIEGNIDKKTLKMIKEKFDNFIDNKMRKIKLKAEKYEFPGVLIRKYLGRDSLNLRIYREIYRYTLSSLAHYVVSLSISFYNSINTNDFRPFFFSLFQNLIPPSILMDRYSGHPYFTFISIIGTTSGLVAVLSGEIGYVLLPLPLLAFYPAIKIAENKYLEEPDSSFLKKCSFEFSNGIQKIENNFAFSSSIEFLRFKIFPFRLDIGNRIFYYAYKPEDTLKSGDSYIVNPKIYYACIEPHINLGMELKLRPFFIYPFASLSLNAISRNYTMSEGVFNPGHNFNVLKGTSFTSSFGWGLSLGITLKNVNIFFKYRRNLLKLSEKFPIEWNITTTDLSGNIFSLGFSFP